MAHRFIRILETFIISLLASAVIGTCTSIVDIDTGLMICNANPREYLPG